MTPAVDEVLQFGDLESLGELRSPVMVIALRGWFDVAGTASAAVRSLIQARQSVTVAEIDCDHFFDFTQARPQIRINDGEVQRIQWPANRIEVSRGEGRDLVALIGTEPHLNWSTYVSCIGAVAQRLRCEAVVTVGAAAEAVPHTRTPLVTGSTTNVELASRLGLSAPTYQGVTGVAGVLQSSLDEIDIPAISLRIGIPHYLIHAEHPQSAAALRGHLAHVLGVPAGDDQRDEIDRWRSLHDEVVDNDDQLALYLRLLEQEYDRRAEASIPSADDLGAQFEEFLRRQRSEE